MGRERAAPRYSRLSGPQLQRHAPPLTFQISAIEPRASRANHSESKSNKLLKPAVNSTQCMAAIQAWGRETPPPIRVVHRYIVKPFGRAGQGAESGLLRMPKQLRRFLAGAVSGAFAKTGTAPLEKLRMSLMTSKAEPLQIIADTWRQGGVAAFFNGNAADVLRVMPSKAIELGAFDGFKRLFSTVSIQRQPHERGFPLHFRPPADGRQVGPVLTMIAGALAGLSSTVACFPLETVRTRLAVEPGTYTSIWNCLVVLTRSQGLGGLYKGLSASAVGAVPYSALRFGAFDGLKHLYRKQAAKGYLVGMHQRGRGHEMQRHAEDIPPMLLVGAGALAGLAASTATFPLEVVRRRMMAGASHPNIAAALSTIVREEGWQALYRGLGVSCIKQAPQTGLTLWAYDACKRLLELDK